jgi:hypothetical protein
MLYLPNYADVLRCIGQFLHKHEIEAFEIKTHLQKANSTFKPDQHSHG